MIALCHAGSAAKAGPLCAALPNAGFSNCLPAAAIIRLFHERCKQVGYFESILVNNRQRSKIGKVYISAFAMIAITSQARSEWASCG